MRTSTKILVQISLLWVAVTGFSCNVVDRYAATEPANPTVISSSELKTETSIPQTDATSFPRTPRKTIETEEPSIINKVDGQLGLGLRRETEDILLAYKYCPGMIMTSNLLLAETYFPERSNWIRTLGAPSLEILQNKAYRASMNNLEYEGLSYGLETSSTTPPEEWMDVVKAAENAQKIADDHGKLIVLGPGFKLMTQNLSSYPDMAVFADIWMIQTQQLQKLGPGKEYRQEVENIISYIHQGNPEVRIWAQVVFPPNMSPDVEEWLAFREAISDLVEGVYIGVYDWDSEYKAQFQDSIRMIFEETCPE